MLPKGKFTGRELSAFVVRKVMTTSLDTNENIVKTDKLACVTEVVFSLDELDNTDTLEDRNLSNMLFRHHLTANGEFASFEPVMSQYNKLKNRELTSLNLKITNQNESTITNRPGIAIVLTDFFSLVL